MTVSRPGLRRRRTQGVAVLLVTAVLAGPPLVLGQESSRELRFSANGRPELIGAWWPAEPGSPGVLLLHQCDLDRRMYDGLAQLLADSGLHVLAFDLRGIGENASMELDRDAATDRANFWRRAEEAMPGDVDAALAALRGADGVDAARIGVMAASCTGREALRLAVDPTIGPNVRALVFLSTRMDPERVGELAPRSTEVPMFWIAAEGDRRAASAAGTGARLASHPLSRSQVYSGRAHGAPLFAERPGLEAEIAGWLADALRAAGTTPDG